MKRKRSNSFERPPGLWFDDGSVILEVESSQFKVHRSMLSNYSVVFRDMFDIPLPSVINDEDVVEGCPVVCLQDNAQDWIVVLKVMYNGM